MKRIGLISILFFQLNYLSSESRADFRFAHPTAEWNVLETTFDLVLNENQRTLTYRVEGDTVIGSFQYQKITGGNFIRQDASGRVFVYDRYQHAAQLKYDFSLGKGDTFTFYNPIFSKAMDFIVDSVDYVQYGSTKKRMFMKCMDNDCFDEIWIHDVGTVNSHFLNPMIDKSVVDGPKYDLLCFHENGATYTPNPKFSSCLVGIKQSEIEKSAQPIYLPESNKISVEIAGNDIAVLSIFNVQGQQLAQRKLSPGMNYISFGQFKSGIYFWTLSVFEGKLQKGKIFIY